MYRGGGEKEKKKRKKEEEEGGERERVKGDRGERLVFLIF